MESDAATRVTVIGCGAAFGLLLGVLVLPLPHEARPDTPASIANKAPSRILDLLAVLFDMMESLREIKLRSRFRCAFNQHC